MCVKVDNGGPAFPAVRFADSGDKGMSLLDWYAGTLLSGMLANPNIHSLTDKPAGPQELTEAAYVLADAMLKQREAKK